MTKQEWLNYIEEDEKYPKRAIILDIYDDFESRVCENCEYFDRYWNVIDEEYDGICMNKTNEVVYDCFLDFGCNKFKRKLNDNK